MHIPTAILRAGNRLGVIDNVAAELAHVMSLRELHAFTTTFLTRDERITTVEAWRYTWGQRLIKISPYLLRNDEAIAVSLAQYCEDQNTLSSIGLSLINDKEKVRILTSLRENSDNPERFEKLLWVMQHGKPL